MKVKIEVHSLDGIMIHIGKKHVFGPHHYTNVVELEDLIGKTIKSISASKEYSYGIILELE